MTTAPRFTVPRDDRRECALYRIYVLDPRTNYTTVTLGYIGETGRMPFTRFMEHLYDQPWGDTIVGTPEVDPQVFTSKAAVLAAEEAAVRAEKPLYNIEYQKGAPHQIPQWTAREQRAKRDRAKGRPTPDWAAKGAAPQPRQTPATRPARHPQVRTTRLPEKWRQRRNKAAIYAAAWSGTVLGLWLTAALFVQRYAHWQWQAWPVLSLGTATWLFLLPLARKPRKKDDRKMVAAAITVAMFVLTGALLTWATGAAQ